MQKKKILISACLLGKKCRYNGNNALIDQLLKLEVDWIPVCPEEEGGLGTPRKPAELTDDVKEVINNNAKVITIDGDDVTNEFIKGAEKCITLGLKSKAIAAILKSRSPSCGSDQVYDGSFKNRLIKGEGIFSHMCRQNGISVISSDNYENNKDIIKKIES